MDAETRSTYGRLHARFVEAWERASRAEHHQHRIGQLQTALADEEEENARLRDELEAEQADVIGLEKFSFKQLRARIGEGIEVAIERERLEAQAAADALTESSEHIAGMRREVERLRSELGGLGGASAEADAARFELETFVRRNFPEAAERLRAVDENIADHKALIVEVEEALAAGNFARLEVIELEGTLARAKSVSDLDLFGGGLLVSISKRDKLRISSEKSREAAFALEIFNREVNDIDLGEVDLRIGEALQFSRLDVWFDNFFADLRTHSKIKEAQAAASQTRGTVETTLRYLLALKTDALAAIEETEAERNRILARAR